MNVPADLLARMIAYHDTPKARGGYGCWSDCGGDISTYPIPPDEWAPGPLRDLGPASILRADTRDAYCPLCDIHLSLHDGPDICTSADAKARLLELYDPTLPPTEEQR